MITSIKKAPHSRKTISTQNQTRCSSFRKVISTKKVVKVRTAMIARLQVKKWKRGQVRMATKRALRMKRKNHLCKMGKIEVKTHELINMKNETNINNLHKVTTIPSHNLPTDISLMSPKTSNQTAVIKLKSLPPFQLRNLN